MAAICAATCEADPGRDKYPKSVAANDKTTIIYFYSIASKLFPGLCLSLASLSVCPSICLPLCRSLARSPHTITLSLSRSASGTRHHPAHSGSSSRARLGGHVHPRPHNPRAVDAAGWWRRRQAPLGRSPCAVQIQIQPPPLRGEHHALTGGRGGLAASTVGAVGVGCNRSGPGGRRDDSPFVFPNSGN